MATPQIPPKPRITLQIPVPQANYGFYGNQNLQPRVPSTAGSNSIHSNPLYVPNFNPNFNNGNFNNMQPMTPVGGIGPDGQQYYNPFLNMYQSKASDYMFKQFEGFKDFTMNTAKSGLSVGEKTAFYMYGKISKWSKKWFTHIFLFLVIMAYTAAGAALFVAVEGTQETVEHTDIRLSRRLFLEDLHRMSRRQDLIEDPQKWVGEATLKMSVFEDELKDFQKQGYTDKGKMVWSFWNAMFYCGTIYTTIGETFSRIIHSHRQLLSAIPSLGNASQGKRN